jgi:hypothetical protein
VRYWQSWVYQSLINLMDGRNNTNLRMPTTIPGSINCLMWWSTSNLQGISSPLLDAGVETLYTMLLRLSMQRSFTFDITRCIQNVEDTSTFVFKINSLGYISGIIYIVGELLIIIICLLMCTKNYFFISSVTWNQRVS